MMITISAAVLLGIAVALLMRFRSLPIASGLVAILFGVFLDASPAGPGIREFFAAVATAANNSL